MATAIVNRSRVGARADKSPTPAKTARMGRPKAAPRPANGAKSLTRAAAAKETAGRFGVYGGRYVPETLMAALEELEAAYEKAKKDKRFQARLDGLRKNFAGRPTPLFFAKRLTEKLGG